ncbi:MAG: FkbM family methyltransferase [Pseudochelatococcus sp.]|jgi:FkbM family methyltransferase|uniref:FkbM family methyltransferase n=1 Tax=Pseudochelatococcus sp. TaxID=2020869 RepID=UPI003D8F0D32
MVTDLIAQAMPTESEPFGAYAPAPFIRSALALTGRLPDTWAGRRCAFFLRNLVLRSLAGAPLDIEALGARMRIKPYNNISEKKVLFTPQFFDAEELAILRAAITEDFVFLDVGANAGFYALHAAAHAGPRARILAIEPQPEVFERLVWNIGVNRFGTVKAIACALADRAGEVTLFLDPSNIGEASIKIVGSANAPTLRVPARTMLDVIRDEGFTHVDAIKLDVQGAEDLILEPFLALAPQSLWPRLLILENSESRWQTDLHALLGQNGFREVARTRLNVVYARG